MSLLVTLDVNNNGAQSNPADPESCSAYPSLDDLPCDGWVWYDEREGTDPSRTNPERASNA